MIFLVVPLLLVGAMAWGHEGWFAMGLGFFLLFVQIRSLLMIQRVAESMRRLTKVVAEHQSEVAEAFVEEHRKQMEQDREIGVAGRRATEAVASVARIEKRYPWPWGSIT